MLNPTKVVALKRLKGDAGFTYALEEFRSLHGNYAKSLMAAWNAGC